MFSSTKALCAPEPTVVRADLMSVMGENDSSTWVALLTLQLHFLSNENSLFVSEVRLWNLISETGSKTAAHIVKAICSLVSKPGIDLFPPHYLVIILRKLCHSKFYLKEDYCLL